MNVMHLILREMRHRIGSSLLALFSISAAVGCLIGALTLLRADDVRTERILADKEEEVARVVADKDQDVTEAVAARQADVAQAGVALEDAMRKITKGLGFNIYILPGDQDVNELNVNGTVSKTMPAEYAKRLADSDIITINHLLPMVMEKLEWEEFKEDIILIGTRGEIPLKERAFKKPLLQQVPDGMMVVGHGLHTKLKLKKDQKVKLNGHEFTVKQTLPERGTSDDVTVWVSLSKAQTMLGRENLINMMQALECNCATEDRVAEIRADLARILPGTQVVELGDRALARAEARNTAKETAVVTLERERAAGAAALAREKQAGEADVARERAGRQKLKDEHEGFAAVLVPLAVLGAAVWIGVLTFGNVRQRRSEIGILRALGLQSAQILMIFLGKALLIGIVGAAVGYAIGFGLGTTWGGEPVAVLFAPSDMLLAVVLAPLLASLGSWLPAMLAARQDPAVVLQGE
jgi:hypothetical protein